jgi:hypothetical protein
MTNDEMQRAMEFIVQQQSQFAANLLQLAEHFKRVEEDRIGDQPRLAELQQSFKDLAELTKVTRERKNNGEFRRTPFETTSTAFESRSPVVDTRSAALEASMVHLAEAQAHADERVSALIDIIIEGRNEAS